MLFINDFDKGFTPVLDVDIQKLRMESQEVPEESS